MPPLGTIVLFVVTMVLLTVDIVLALCLGLILPDYITSPEGYYPATGQEVSVSEAAYYCACLLKYLSPYSSELIKLEVIEGKVKRSIDEAAYGRYLEDYTRFPFLVSLRFDEESRACNGLVNGLDEVITLQKCVPKAWNNVFVQTLDELGTSEGLEFRIVNVTSRFNAHLVVLKIESTFPFYLLPSNAIRLAVDANWTIASALTLQKLPFSIDTYTTKQLRSEPVEVSDHFSETCLDSTFLISDLNELLGVKNCAGFYNLGTRFDGKSAYQIYKID